MVGYTKKIDSNHDKHEWGIQNEIQSQDRARLVTEEFSILDQFFLRPSTKASKGFDLEEFDPEAAALQRKKKKLMRQFEKNQARFSQIMEKDDIVKFQRLSSKFDSKNFSMDRLINDNSASYLTN